MKKGIIFFGTLFVAMVLMAAYSPDSGGLAQRLINGYVADITSGDDIWVGDGAYPFQSAAVTTYASSSSASDAAAGTGCRTALVEGLSSTYAYQSETVTLNGTSNVALSNTYLRINKVTCSTVGSGGLNAGVINVGAVGTALQKVNTSAGSSASAIYTSPSGKNDYIAAWSFSLKDTAAAYGQVALQIQPYGGSWRTVAESAGTEQSGLVYMKFENPILIPPKSDVRIRCLTCSGNPEASGAVEILEKL